ncbi:MAG: nucleotide sugar dehydrogenase [Natrialbaceae archaeon]|nr:nucleotide sugar dehydrogenase [Natrialbaceae archaeon]
MNHEPGLASLIDRMVSADRLEATTDGLAAATAARVYVIVVPTLLTESKAPDLSMVQSALETIAKGLDQGDLVLIESTLPPGTTQSMVRPLLARESTLELDDLRVAYCPERTSSGTALRDIRGQYPRIVGGVDQPSAEAAARVYEALSSNSVTVVSNATTAEYVKLFEGIYRDVNIALANEFVRVVESTTVSVREAIEAANALPMCDIHDPGPGVGGHCIPVYPYFLEGTVEGDAPLTATARAVNEAMPSYTVAWIDRILSSEGLPLRKSTVAVMGLTYRANIPETRWSPGIDIVVELERLGATTYGVDPLVDPTSVACPVEDLEYLREHGADAVIVTSPHEVFQTLDWSTLDPLVILDGRDALDLESDRHRVYTLGGSQSDIEPTGQSPSRPSGGK